MKTNFGRSERELYKRAVIPVFGRFLKKSYSTSNFLFSLLSDLTVLLKAVEECRARALPVEVPSLQSLISEEDGELELHCVDWDQDASPASGSTTSKQPAPQPPGRPLVHTSVPPKRGRESAPPPYVPCPPSTPTPLPPDAGLPINSPTGSLTQSPGRPPVQSLSGSPIGSPTHSPASSPVRSPVARVLPTSQHAAGPTKSSHPPATASSRPDSQAPPTLSPTLTTSAHTPTSQSPGVLWTTAAATPAPADGSVAGELATTPNSGSVVVLNDDGQGLTTKKRRQTRDKAGGVARTGKGGQRSRKSRVAEKGAASAEKKQQKMTTRTTPPATSSARKRSHADVGDAPVAKRSRLSITQYSASTAAGAADQATTAPPAPVLAETQLPQDAPKWFVDTVTLLRLAPWKGPWAILLSNWLKYELRNDLGHDGKLGTTGRPACVGGWISRARSPKYRPGIKDLSRFETEFWNWWKGLQPAWRKDLQRKGGDWTALHKPGVNGLASVLAALFYWGMELGAHRESSPGWSRAIDDVTWVLLQL